MAENKSGFERVYENLSAWFTDIKAHEITKVVEVVETAKGLLAAAESLPEERVRQFLDNFRYDLREFYRQNQSQAQHSVYLGLLNEEFWDTLAKMTDRSQVEWTELCDDLEHQGVYHSGDFIGFGVLECQHCHEKLTVSHFSEVADCMVCGGKSFVRHGLTP
ncbi:zinc ribbon-containing protein [Thalassomonas haliotis]|uniref:Zinc ribbon-containing protein n=1 Tax=Thalassomonas haliotis TaxID=485448 RepID=A0ABY7VIN6_9GAMM|nr:hypothetical protein [Thalassomonas haliotis]WDE13350.1 hypothetical protein H3N35_07890 [Thalassomonas haliotis]